MSLGILGIKVGMTQVFDEEQRSVVPVTVVHAEPNVILRRFTKAVDGYSAVQVACKDKNPARMNRPDKGQFASASAAAGKTIAPKAVVREFRLAEDPPADLAVGAELTVARFDGVTFIDVAGTSKGKGTQGVMKKYHFKGFERSHGTHEYFRHGGSVGTRLTPGHVLPGKRMPSRMGNVRVTTQNLRLHGIDREKNLLYVVGSIPGYSGSVIEIRPACKKKQ